MSWKSYLAVKNLEQSNRYLRADNLAIFNEKKMKEYFKDFRLVFLKKSKHMTKSTFKELCDLNSLYSLQIKLKVKLPHDLEELAYDLDNPDYPGLEQVLEKVRKKEYAIFALSRESDR